jgi:hypothetical protein
MLAPPLDEKVALRRRIERFPFPPSDPALLDENCYEAFNIQVHGLMTRLDASNTRKVGSASRGPRFDACADRGGARLRPAGMLAPRYPVVHAAGLRHLEAHQEQRRCPDAGLGVSAQEIVIAPSAPDARRYRATP